MDGYNVVNDWPELVALRDSLEYARDRLLAIVSEYCSYQGYQGIVVFDAHLVIGADRRKDAMGELTVIYTREGETADSYIERTAYDYVRQGYRVFVVTSDWAEQLVILGAGAFRISARELRVDVKKTKQRITEELAAKELKLRRHELGSRLQGDVLERLDAMRRDRE